MFSPKNTRMGTPQQHQQQQHQQQQQQQHQQQTHSLASVLTSSLSIPSHFAPTVPAGSSPPSPPSLPPIGQPTWQRTGARTDSPTTGRRPHSDVVLPSFDELLQGVSESSSRPLSAPPEGNVAAYSSLQRALRAQPAFPPSQQQQQQSGPSFSATTASQNHPSFGFQPQAFGFQGHSQQQQQQQEPPARPRFGTGLVFPGPVPASQPFNDPLTRELKQAQQLKLEQQQQQQQQQQQRGPFSVSPLPQRHRAVTTSPANATILPRATPPQSPHQERAFGIGHAPSLSGSAPISPTVPHFGEGARPFHHLTENAQVTPSGTHFWQSGSDHLSFVPMFSSEPVKSTVPRSHPPVIVSSNPKKTRSNFSKEIIAILKQWLVTHWDNPYPSSEDKRLLMAQTGLDKKQIINWFINARRRLVVPKKGQPPTSGPPSILFSDDEDDSDDDHGGNIEDIVNEPYDPTNEENDEIMSTTTDQSPPRVSHIAASMNATMSPKPQSHQQAFVNVPKTNAARPQQQQQQQQGFAPPQGVRREAPRRTSPTPSLSSSPPNGSTSVAISSLMSLRQQPVASFAPSPFR